MARVLEAQSLEIRASWDGDVSHAVDVVITVEIESEPGTELPLLDTTSSRISLKHSALWQMKSVSQECTLGDTESVDDAGSRYFSLDAGGGAPITPAKNRTPQTYPTNLPISPRRRLFPPSPAIVAQEAKQVPLERRAGCPQPDHSLRGLDINLESSYLSDLDDDGDDDDDNRIPALPTISHGLSHSSDLRSSPEILSTLPSHVDKCDASAADHLLRKRTFDDARLSDSGSSCPDEPQCDETSPAHHVPAITSKRIFLPTSDFDFVIRHPPPLATSQYELRTPSKSAERPKDVQDPKVQNPNSASNVPVRGSSMSPTTLWGYSDLNDEDSPHSKEISSSICSAARELGEFKNDGNMSATTRIDSSDVDDLELPPSPTPSSKDLMPWSSTYQVLNNSCYTTSDDNGEISFEGEGHTASESHPIVTLRNGQLVLEIPGNVKRSIYKLKIVACLELNPEEDNWSSLLLSGLMPASTGTPGAVFFDIPRQIGIEFQTKSLHGAEIVNSCFKAHFILTEWLCISLRLCAKECYTIRSFEVKTEIRTDSFITENRARISPRLRLSNYASCMVIVPDVCYSVDKSCFTICVDGGPRGHFTCEVKPQEDVHFIQLDKCNEQSIGICHVEITCSSQALKSLCIVWQVELEGRKTSTWQPRVYPALEASLTRNGPDLRQRLANVEDSILFYSESDTQSEYSTDDDDYQSTSSSEMILYPEESFDVGRILLFPFQVFRAFDGLQPHSVRGPRRLTIQEIIISMVLAILIFQAGLSQLHNLQGQLTSWVSNFEIPSRGIQALGHNIKQMARYGFSDTEEMHRTNAVSPYLDCICSNPRFSDAGHSSASSDATDWDSSPSVSIPENETIQILEEPDNDPVRNLTYGVEIGKEQDVSGIPVACTKNSKATMTVRDRVDYFLGWKGPLESL